ncbi:MAG: glycosyltransferase family 4 protein [Cytophagia bacterium]|nr:glycosyltransferase family 4 protein [Cytophagia bacterium]
MLLHEFYPNDIRVGKESSALIKAGYEVHLICLKRKNEPTQETINGLIINRVPMAQSFFWRGIWDVLLVILNFHQPVFYRKLKQKMREERFGAIHVHDLPLAQTALKARKLYPETKVVLDFHENYPEALKVWFQWKVNPIIRFKNRLFFGYTKWLRYERKASDKSDHLIVVVDEMKERIQQVQNINTSKISVITNSESIDFLNQKIHENVYARKPRDFILAYTGNVGPHRGVDTIIKALSHLRDYPHIKLEITGKLSDDSHAWLSKLIKENQVENQVKINGYQPFEKFYSYMALADVNLIPHNRNGHTDNTIPHKLYQGMLVGKPVLVSDAPPLKRVVKELNSGLVFEAGNDKDCAEKVRMLYSNSELFDTLGKNGFNNTTSNGFNWESEGQKLCKLYDEILHND